MKPPHAARLTGLATALLFSTASGVSAQFHVGMHGTLADVRSVAAGVGGRLSYFQPGGAGGTEFGIETTYGIFFPSCIGRECHSTGGHAVLVASRDIGFGGGPQTYFGVGARFQDVKLDNGAESFEGDFWGFTMLFGSRMHTDATLAPFFEMGWSFMDDLADIWDITLGVRLSLG